MLLKKVIGVKIGPAAGGGDRASKLQPEHYQVMGRGCIGRVHVPQQDIPREQHLPG